MSRDVRKALNYLDIKARRKVGESELIEEKQKLATEALEAINDVITTLQDEKEYSPVTILGVTMTEELINTLVSLLFMVGFTVMNKVLGLNNPF